MRRLILLGAVWTCSCGSSDEGAPPSACDPFRDRVGTYLLSLRERSGDCGPIEDSLVRLGEGSAPIGADNCRLLADPTLSDGDCTIEQSVECQLADGLTSITTAITTQMDEDGSLITGTLDLRGTDSSGRLVCHSVYDATYTRQ